MSGGAWTGAGVSVRGLGGRAIASASVAAGAGAAWGRPGERRWLRRRDEWDGEWSGVTAMRCLGRCCDGDRQVNSRAIDDLFEASTRSISTGWIAGCGSLGWRERQGRRRTPSSATVEAGSSKQPPLARRGGCDDALRCAAMRWIDRARAPKGYAFRSLNDLAQSQAVPRCSSSWIPLRS